MGTRLQGKTALVTGATRNIGRAIALAYGREGAHVAVVGRDVQRGNAVVDEIRAAGGEADFIAAELDGSPAASQALAAQARQVLGGRVDILVNNVGVWTASSLAGTTEQAYDRVFDVNVKAPFFLTAELIPEMAERGEGVVINLGSWIARLSVHLDSAYQASKGAMETMTRAWAAEFGPSGVRVNAISPGVVHERRPEEAHRDAGEVMMKGTPAGDIGHPSAIGDAAVFLASEEASFIHGTVLDVDGGRTAAAVIAAA